MYVCLYVYMYVCMHVSLFVCLVVCLFVCFCSYVQTYAHTVYRMRYVISGAPTWVLETPDEAICRKAQTWPVALVCVGVQRRGPDEGPMVLIVKPRASKSR